MLAFGKAWRKGLVSCAAPPPTSGLAALHKKFQAAEVQDFYFLDRSFLPWAAGFTSPLRLKARVIRQVRTTFRERPCHLEEAGGPSALESPTEHRRFS